MKISTGTVFGALIVLSSTLWASCPGWSQERVGIVTAVAGPVTIARMSMPPEILTFKDNVFVRDRVTTGDSAITRILLGGKIIVTVRERSTLMITESAGLSTIDLLSGRIAVAVDRTRMLAGERVDVRTPNAVAGVRGTVLVVEALNDTSTITVLRGLVEVMRLDAGTGVPVGAITAVGARETVSVRNGVLAQRPTKITPGRSDELSREFSPPLRSVPATAVLPVDDLLSLAGVTTAPDSGPSMAVATTPTGAAAKAKETAVISGVGGTPAQLTSASGSTKANSPNHGTSLLHTASKNRKTP